MTIQRLLSVLVFAVSAFSLQAQDVSNIQFCDKKYEYGQGKDSITLFLKVLDGKGKATTWLIQGIGIMPTQSKAILSSSRMLVTNRTCMISFSCWFC